MIFLSCVRKKRKTGQSTIEFTFGLIVLSMIVFALVQAFRWNMMNFAEQRFDHDQTIALADDVSKTNWMSVKFKTSFGWWGALVTVFNPAIGIPMIVGSAIAGMSQCPGGRSLSEPNYDICWDDTFDPEEQLSPNFHQQRKLDLIPMYSDQGVRN